MQTLYTTGAVIFVSGGKSLGPNVYLHAWKLRYLIRYCGQQIAFRYY